MSEITGASERNLRSLLPPEMSQRTKPAKEIAANVENLQDQLSQLIHKLNSNTKDSGS